MPDPPQRHMKYPYTLTAKIVQFPYKYYWNNVWLFKWFAFGAMTSFPIFVWIHKQANSPANVAKWAETQRKIAEQDAEKHHH